MFDESAEPFVEWSLVENLNVVMLMRGRDEAELKV